MDQADKSVRAPTSAWRQVLSGLQTLASGGAYALLIVTFVFQVARVDGLSMEPTLKDHDRLIVNRLTYRWGDPRPGDIVILYYPRDPTMLFVKRVIAGEGDVARSVDGTVFVNEVRVRDDYVREEFPQPRRLGPRGRAGRLLSRDGRPSEQQLRQSRLGPGAEEVHRR
jgi:signal peptidase I, bacterial type